MGVRAMAKPVWFISILLVILAFLGWPVGGYAAHDIGQDCYTCHNIGSGQVWAGSYSIWTGKVIGMTPYSRPITCDVCHTDYGNRFKSTSASHHPVAVIADNTMSSDYDNGVRVNCRDCHNGNSVTSLTPNLIPDLAPTDYLSTAGNTTTDGYPNHDVLAPNNQVAAGDNAHLLSMLLSAGQRTVNGSSVYNKVPSANPAADYAFCLACHDGGANTARAVNVRQDYIDKGHYFKATGGGITAGDRLPCSDCHASHNSPTNARLFEPDSATFTGTRPSGLAFASPYAPTNAEYRAICIFCHNDYNAGNTGNGAPLVRGVEPTPRKFGISGHAPTDTQSCKQCHNPHKTPGGGPECLTCHTTGGAAGATYDYIDALFKGVGSDNTATQPASSGSLIWSQHGGFVSVGGPARFLYASPYNTKASNDCFKCHGDRHNNTYALIDADTGGTDTYAYNPSIGMSDNTAAGIVNANAFCLTCHDGNGAAADVQIGNTAPPNVAANYAASGHGLAAASTYGTTGNKGAAVKCTACHEVHGSNHAKLLPAKKDATGNFVVPAAMPEKTFRNGALLSRNVDFTDYSSPLSTFGFGTTGDPGDQHTPAGATTGFCDACHRQAGQANGGTDNVTNKAHTHEGIAGQGSPASQMTFTKDCLECHDTHGTTNLEMVRTTVNGVTPVTFTARTGANSLDPVEAGSTVNANSVCTACHQNSTESPSLNVTHNFRSSTVNPDHNEGTNCTSCHAHGSSTDATKYGFPQGSCTSCHGNGTNGTYWPDNAVLGAAYPTRAGAHPKHVTAIASARGIGANATCDTCHPGNPPAGHDSDTTTGASQAEVTRMDTTGNGYSGPPTAGDYWSYAGSATATTGTAVYFKTMSGANDNNGYFGVASRTCSNIDCHGGNATPAWYADTAAPTWSPSYNISATGSAGYATVNWAIGTDSTGPVLYDLYYSTTNTAAAVFAGPPIQANILDNTATVALGAGTYYFGVRARDSVTPTPNATSGEGISAGATVTTPTGGTVATTYFLSKTSGNAYGTTAENMPNCGTTGTVAAAGTTATSVPPGKGILATGYACAASVNNYVSNSSPNNGGGTTFEAFVGFYKPGTYPVDTVVTGNATGNNFGFRGSAGTEDVRIRLVAVNPSTGAHTSSAATVNLANIGTTFAAFTPNLSTLSINVPAGQTVGVVFSWADTSTTASTNDRMGIDYYSTAITSSIVLNEPPPADNTAPTWAGGTDNIVVSNPATGGKLNISWNTATDGGSPTSPPVKYTLYRSSASAADVWNNVLQDNLYVRSIQDNTLTNGLTYYYGVRAKDSASPANPTTNTTTASGIPTGPGGCTTCHGTPPATGAHLKHATADTVYTDCDKCHGDATRNVTDNYTTYGPSGLHNNGTVNLYFGRIPGETDAAWNGTTCATVDCHFNAATPNWVGGTTNCGSCHQYPPTTQAGTVDHDAGLTVAPATLSNFLASHGDCEVCHGAKSSDGTVNGTFTTHANYPAGSHADGFIRMNGPAATSTGTQYVDNGAAAGGCNKACHANDATYRMTTSSARNVNYADFGAGDCVACHKAGGTGSIVTGSSPHVSTTVGGAFNACTDCHPGATKGGFHSRNADANVAVIPNYTTVGISYTHTVDGATQGFVLGGDATSGTTEAEICWNCHAGVGVSEWGVNTDTNGAASNYDYGTLWSAATGGTAVSNWVGVYWRSARVAATPSFAYKTGMIASTHAANSTANAQGVDAVGNIRCSNCHDVHNTAGTKFTALGQAAKAANDPSGKPFLRGTWMGSPYNEDGAPQLTGTSYPAMNTTTNPWGPVPRGGATNGVQMGGYWIDQNSGNPAGSWTPNQFAGLCELCHGNGDGDFTAAEIDALNQFGAQGAGWVSGANGHVNSVQGASHNATATTGGTNNQGNNIFAGRGGATNQTSATNSHPFMLFDGTSMPGDAAGGFRAGDSQFGYLPAMSARPTDGDGWVNTQWNNITGRTLDLRGTVVNTNFHSFPCSKCHTPHASRLPTLMISNCLDTKHNTWDNNFQVIGSTVDSATVNRGRSLSNWSSAQNCHRLVGDDPTDARETPGNATLPGNAGWNTVTPW